MGEITLPDSGLVYVDAPAVIYSVETQPPYWPLLEPLWEAADAGRATLVTSELTLLEVLVGPLRSGDAALTEAYEELFRAALRPLGITRAVVREAAQVRAEHNLRTPDAIHAATALLHGCRLFVTNDGDFRRVPALPLALLDELLAGS